jgi:mRNA interferase RelE/StbE
MRAIRITKDVRKFLDRLDAKQFKQVVNKMLSLMVDPEPNDSALLKGYDYRRTDIGEFRIVYTFDEEVVSVAVVGKRNDGEVYKGL